MKLAAFQLLLVWNCFKSDHDPLPAERLNIAAVVAFRHRKLEYFVRVTKQILFNATLKMVPTSTVLLIWASKI